MRGVAQTYNTPVGCLFPIFRKGIMKLTKNTKTLITVLALLAALAVLVGVMALAERSAYGRAGTDLSIADAQAIVNEQLSALPSSVADCAIYIVENSHVTVTDLAYGEEKDVILTCRYETIDVAGIVAAHKNEFLSMPTTDPATGKAMNATKIKLMIQEELLELFRAAAPVTGTVELRLYEVHSGEFDLHLSREVVDTVFGGILTASDDVANTDTIIVDGEEVSIVNRTSLKNGLKSCFALVNYDASKPDTSNALGRAWHSFKDDFHRNFIAENRWTYLVTGLGNTLALTFLSLVIGLILGFVLAIIRCTHDKTGALVIPNAIAKLYLAVIRGTPVMVQLIIIYFVCLLPVGIEAFPSAVLCFGLNSAAYVAEIVRGGIMSVDEGQTEAGRSLGLNYIQTMTYIIIPQAFKAVLPSLANEFITLLKESSVAFTIGVVELTQGGMKIRSITYTNFMPLLAVALIYLVLVLFLSHLVSLLERRLRQNER